MQELNWELPDQDEANSSREYDMSSINADSKSNCKVLSRLGLSEILLGIISMSLSITAASITRQEAVKNLLMKFPEKKPSSISQDFCDFNCVGQGIWGGAVLVIPGLLAIAIRATTNPRKGLYIANLVMAVITAFVEAGALVLSGFFVAKTTYYSTALFLIHVLIAFLAFAAIILIIIHSAFCCRELCSKYSSKRSRLIHFPKYNSDLEDSQYFRGPNGYALPKDGGLDGVRTQSYYQQGTEIE